MDLQLKNKVGLVTGGASGIGKATVELLAAEGVRVAIVDQNEAAGSALAARLNATHTVANFISADLTHESDCEQCVAKTLAAFGSIDVLVNNAGGNDSIGLEKSPIQFMQSLERNLFH